MKNIDKKSRNASVRTMKSNLEEGNVVVSIVLFIVIISFAWIIGNAFKKESWKGYYYPNSQDLLNYTESPVYSSLQECRNWVQSQVNQYNPSGSGYDYECGKNCELKEGYTSLVCDETVK